MKYLVLVLLLSGCTTTLEVTLQKACIQTFSKGERNKLYERVMVVEEYSGTEWLVYSVDNPRINEGKNFTYPVSKRDVHFVGMPGCPSDIWGLTPQTMHDIRRQNDTQ